MEAGAANAGNTTAIPVAEVWYGIEVYANDIIRFRELYIDSFAVGDIWLVRGSDRALAVDTGSGIVPACPVVEAVAGTPVTAVALNPYYDHAGAWHEFSDRACHPLDAPELANPVVENEWISDYLDETTLWALPNKDFDLKTHKMKPACPTRLVEDGDVFNLGSRSLEVLHIPGRSPGGLAIWEKSTGSLFTSDMLYDGRHGLAWPPDDIEAYCNSLKRLRVLPVAMVYPGHYGVMRRDQMLQVIDEQLSDLESRLDA